MAGIVEWVKNYSMVFLLMTVLTSMTAKKEYSRYIQLFVEMVLVITLITPFLKATGRSEDLFEKISYDSFWQGLDNIRSDQEKLEFLNGDYYIRYYEEVIGEDISAMAEDAGYAVIDVNVAMNESYEVTDVSMKVAKQRTEQIIIGSIKELPEDAAITELKEKIAGYYQMDVSNITIRD